MSLKRQCSVVKLPDSQSFKRYHEHNTLRYQTYVAVKLATKLPMLS